MKAMTTLGRAIYIREPGKPEVLEERPYSVRAPGASEVRVAIQAAGLNRADCLQRRGLYPAPKGTVQDVPGLEYAGHIAEVGSGVTGWNVGDPVMGIASGGAMATEIVVHERLLVPIPVGMDVASAAGIPEVFFTVYDALFRQASVSIGQTVLIHAAGSGIGTAAGQLVHAAGARAIGSSRSPHKVERARQAGFDDVVLVRDGSFADAVRTRCERGVDVVLDTVGAAYFQENLRSLCQGGHLLVIGLLGGQKAEISLAQLLQKRARVSGSVLRSRPHEEKAMLTQAFVRDVLPLLARRTVEPVIQEVMPMRDIAEAHRRLEANEVYGKLVLSWSA